MKNLRIGILVASLAFAGCERSVQSTADSKNLDQVETQEFVSIEVEVGPLAAQKPYEFFNYGRPEDAYALTYAHDKKICSILTHALNKPGTYDSDRGYIVHQSDILLKSSLSVEWMKLGSSSRPVEYVEKDLNNDGVIDNIVRQMEPMGSGLVLSGLFFSWIKVTEENPNNSYLTAEMMNSFSDAYNTNKNKFSDKSPGLFGLRIQINESTVDFREAKRPTEKRRLKFGQFVDIVTIFDRRYILAGGAIDSGLVAIQPNSPLYLLELTGENQFKLFCELTPRYKHIENYGKPKE